MGLLQIRIKTESGKEAAISSFTKRLRNISPANIQYIMINNILRQIMKLDIQFKTSGEVIEALQRFIERVNRDDEHTIPTLFMDNIVRPTTYKEKYKKTDMVTITNPSNYTTIANTVRLGDNPTTRKRRLHRREENENIGFINIGYFNSKKKKLIAPIFDANEFSIDPENKNDILFSYINGYHIITSWSKMYFVPDSKQRSNDIDIGRVGGTLEYIRGRDILVGAYYMSIPKILMDIKQFLEVYLF